MTKYKAAATAAVFFCAQLLAGAAVASGDPGYLAQLQTRAQTQQLAQAPAWLRLLHTRPQRFGGMASTIDDPLFFRAADGKHDPSAELAATLAAFFDDTPIAGEPAQCRYKARYEWLRTQLTFDDARLPPQACAMYAQWAQGLNAGALAVVFASNDLNSPSSMFGHMLLRVDGQGDQAKARLLSYAVNYAAETTRDGGMSYALKGLTGAYRGYYSVMPYYDKVKQYEHVDHRDLWEYPLLLDADARQKLLWHLWELRGIGSDYYFFSENCAYQLLALIGVARPELSLTGDFEHPLPYTIPIDSVRALNQAGLLGAPVYHPSNARQLQLALPQLTPSAQDWVFDYAAGRSPLDDARYATATPQQQARMLEIAHQLLYLRFSDGELSRERGLQRDREALLARSRIETAADFAAIPTPATAPDQGHDSARVSIGVRADRSTAAELRWRPAYHDRLDPPGGYLAGAELQFLDLGLLADQHGVHLADAKLLAVQAIATRDRSLQPMSWQFSTGLRRAGLQADRADADGALGFYVDGGTGLAWAPLPAMQLWSFAIAAADGNPDLRSDYALRVGLRAGLAWQAAPHWSTELQADALQDLRGHDPLQRYTAAVQWHPLRNHGLRLQLERGLDQGDELSALKVLYQRYF